jgi:hypothetical protein
MADDIMKFGSYDEYLKYQQSLGRFDNPGGIDQVQLPDVLGLNLGPTSPTPRNTYEVTPMPRLGVQTMPTSPLPGPNPLPGTLIQAPMYGPFNQAATTAATSGVANAAASGATNAFANMSPTMQAGMIGGIAGIAQGLIGRRKRRAEQNAAAAEYRGMRRRFENLDTSNLAANIQNPFAENVFEDLTVNRQAAEFAAQQGQQARANIMSQFRGVAGGSGIAGLAQSLANQATTASQQAAASIAMQEQQNARLAAQGQLQVQKGEAMIQQIQLAGEERARALDYRQTGTLFGMAQQRKRAADQAVAQANAALYGGIGQLAGTFLTGGMSNMAQGLTFMGNTP